MLRGISSLCTESVSVYWVSSGITQLRTTDSIISTLKYECGERLFALPDVDVTFSLLVNIFPIQKRSANYYCAECGGKIQLSTSKMTHLIDSIENFVLFQKNKRISITLMPLLLPLLLLLIRLQRKSTGSDIKRATLWKNHIHFPFVILLSTVNYCYLLFIKFWDFHNFHFATKRDFERGSFWLLFIFT